MHMVFSSNDTDKVKVVLPTDKLWARTQTLRWNLSFQGYYDVQNRETIKTIIFMTSWLAKDMPDSAKNVSPESIFIIQHQHLAVIPISFIARTFSLHILTNLWQFSRLLSTW